MGRNRGMQYALIYGPGMDWPRQVVAVESETEIKDVDFWVKRMMLYNRKRQREVYCVSHFVVVDELPEESPRPLAHDRFSRRMQRHWAEERCYY